MNTDLIIVGGSILILCIIWAEFSYKIMEAIRNKVEKELIDYYLQCWVYQENYCISCGIISLLFRHSRKGDINKDRWPFVLRLNKSHFNCNNSISRNTMRSLHAQYMTIEYMYFISTHMCQVLYIFMYYYQQKHIKTKQNQKLRNV